LGEKIIAFTRNQKTKGGGVKKAVFDKAEVSYSIEQSQKKDELPTTTQKVGSEYKITDGISVEAERELKYNSKNAAEENKSETNDKVLLKYKKPF